MTIMKDDRGDEVQVKNDTVARKYGPRCPNHGVPLILTSDPKVGICPISSCRFEYDDELEEGEDEAKIEVDINGEYVVKPNYKIKPLDDAKG